MGSHLLKHLCQIKILTVLLERERFPAKSETANEQLEVVLLLSIEFRLEQIQKLLPENLEGVDPDLQLDLFFRQHPSHFLFCKFSFKS